MRKLLFITFILNGCYNAHYYPSSEEPVSAEGDEINVEIKQPAPQAQPSQPSQPSQRPPVVKKTKTRKCKIWE